MKTKAKMFGGEKATESNSLLEMHGVEKIFVRCAEFVVKKKYVRHSGKNIVKRISMYRRRFV